MNILNKKDIERHLPKKIYLTTSNGNFQLNLTDCIMNLPQIQVVYHHFTPENTDDPLTDGEPDYFGIDFQIKKNEKGHSLYFDITYGDAMMFSFEVFPNNKLKVGHYNGFDSKFDPKYEFYLQENTIKELLNFINNLVDDIKITRDKLNFLDGDKNSFKMEKVRWISDFNSFNRLNRL